jgi:glucose-1-phosphate thymidylyltransferase
MAHGGLKKAVVLCAGEGTRLRPLTFSRPKHLLPVAGRPLLGWALDALAEVGVEQVALVVGHRPEAIQRYVGDGSAWGLRACYVTQEKPLGLAHAVACARDFVGDDEFLLYLGDNLLESGVGKLVSAYLERRPAAALFVKEVEDPRAYGVAVTQGDRVASVEEKPEHPPSNLAIVGAYVFSPAIMQAIRETPPSPRGEYEITDAIKRLIGGPGGVIAVPVEGFWEDAGRPAELLRANRLYLDRMKPEVAGHINAHSRVEGPVRVGRGTRVINCTLLGPCLVGENCLLSDSVIGPYVSIDSGTHVTDSRVENCIVQQDCKIHHLQGGLRDSVLGTQVEVLGREGGSQNPLSLLLGDLSSIRAF